MTGDWRACERMPTAGDIRSLSDIEDLYKPCPIEDGKKSTMTMIKLTETEKAMGKLAGLSEDQMRFAKSGRPSRELTDAGLAQARGKTADTDRILAEAEQVLTPTEMELAKRYGTPLESMIRAKREQAKR